MRVLKNFVVRVTTLISRGFQDKVIWRGELCSPNDSIPLNSETDETICSSVDSGVKKLLDGLKM